MLFSDPSRFIRDSNRELAGNAIHPSASPTGRPIEQGLLTVNSDAIGAFGFIIPVDHEQYTYDLDTRVVPRDRSLQRDVMVLEWIFKKASSLRHPPPMP